MLLAIIDVVNGYHTGIPVDITCADTPRIDAVNHVTTIVVAQLVGHQISVTHLNRVVLDLQHNLLGQDGGLDVPRHAAGPIGSPRMVNPDLTSGANGDQ